MKFVKPLLCNCFCHLIYLPSQQEACKLAYFNLYPRNVVMPVILVIFVFLLLEYCDSCYLIFYIKNHFYFNVYFLFIFMKV